MEPIKTIWVEDTVVRTSETDFLKRWKLSAFFVGMMEVASHHAAHLGYDYQSMMANDMTWVLSRAKIQFFNFPEMEEKVTLKTWPKGLQQKVFFMRDFEITGVDGCRLAAASLAYVLISISKRRILMNAPLYGIIPDNNGLSAIAEPLEKIPPVEPLADVYTTQAAYSGVDLMGHVNNARYIDWISDCFSLEEYRSQKPGWLQVNYINEVLPGESVTLAKAASPADPGTWYIAGTNQQTGARAFEAAFHWE
jgi:medium-chain acyl-[acyl-carrier-protein] hydrolase